MATRFARRSKSCTKRSTRDGAEEGAERAAAGGNSGTSPALLNRNHRQWVSFRFAAYWESKAEQIQSSLLPTNRSQCGGTEARRPQYKVVCALRSEIRHRS